MTDSDGSADQISKQLGIIGDGLSPCIQRVRQYARKDVPVLLVGPTGTGKELLADAYAITWCGERSLNAKDDFRKLNCTAFSDELLHAALFGVIKGAFTGADKNRDGFIHRYRLVCLDELGDASHKFQAALLRVVENHQYSRVGSSEIERTDVRFIASTNRPMGIRDDLANRFYPIEVPLLAKRPNDIAALVAHLGKENGITHVTRRFIKYAGLHTWPGNVRELRRYIEEASLTGVLDIPAAVLSPVNPSLPLSFKLARDGGFLDLESGAERVPLEEFTQQFHAVRPVDWTIDQRLLAEQHERLKGRPDAAPQLARLEQMMNPIAPPSAAAERNRERGRLTKALADAGSVAALAANEGLPRTTMTDRLKAFGVEPDQVLPIRKRRKTTG